VGRALGDLSGELRCGDGVRPGRLPSLLLGCGVGAAPGRLLGRRAHLAGHRVDPAPVPDHDPLPVAVLDSVVAVVVVTHFLSFSSSTISASTTSSEPPAWLAPPVAAPAAPSAPACW